MQVRVRVGSDFRRMLVEEQRRLEVGTKTAVRQAGDFFRQRMVQDTRASFRSPRGLANSWRSRTYPPGQPSINAASIVWSNAPLLIYAFSEGVWITVRRAKYLCIPSSYNLPGGRRRSVRTAGKPDWYANVRVKPEQMKRSRQAFTTRGANGWLIWWLQVNPAQARRGRRGAIRSLAFAGGIAQVGGRSQLRNRMLIRRGAVPMFFLRRSVKMPKLLAPERRLVEALYHLDTLMTQMLALAA